MISRKQNTPPWTTGEVQTTVTDQSTTQPFYYLVLGEEKVTYSTGVEYKRNDYVYAKYGVLNGAKDIVCFKGVRIYRDYASAPLSNGVSGDTYYQLMQTNKGNAVCGIYQSPKNNAGQVAMHYTGTTVTSLGDYHTTEFDPNKLYLSTIRGFSKTTMWPVIHAYNNVLNVVTDKDPLTEIIMNPSPQTYTYKYVSRGTTVKTGTLILGANPTAPSNPAAYQDVDYNYTFKQWNLTYSGDNRTYTAEFTAVAATKTVIWKNYAGSTLQTKTYTLSNEPAYSGGTPTQTTTNSSYYPRYQFDGWGTATVSSDGRTKTYIAQMSVIPYYVWLMGVSVDRNYRPDVIHTYTPVKIDEFTVTKNSADPAADGYISIYGLNNYGTYFTALGLKHENAYLHIYQVENTSQYWEINSSGVMTFYGGTASWSGLSYGRGHASVSAGYGSSSTNVIVNDASKPVYVWMSKAGTANYYYPLPIRQAQVSITNKGTSTIGSVYYPAAFDMTNWTKKSQTNKANEFRNTIGHPFSYLKCTFIGDNQWKIEQYIGRGNVTNAALFLFNEDALFPTYSYCTGSYSDFTVFGRYYVSNDSNYIACTIQYLNGNGSTVLQESQYQVGSAMPTYTGTIPTPENTVADLEGVFREWQVVSQDGYISTTGLPRFTFMMAPVFDIYELHKTQWVSEGTVLKTVTHRILKGGSPTFSASSAYDGTTPSKTGTSTTKYEFSSWSSSSSSVTRTHSWNKWGIESSNIQTRTHTAVFNTITLKTVKWVSEGTTLQTSTYWSNATEPSYTGSTPTKASSSTYKYTFSSWSKSTSGNTITYTATFSSTRYYTWEKYNAVASGYEISQYITQSINDDAWTNTVADIKENAKAFHGSSYSESMWGKAIWCGVYPLTSTISSVTSPTWGRKNYPSSVTIGYSSTAPSLDEDHNLILPSSYSTFNAPYNSDIDDITNYYVLSRPTTKKYFFVVGHPELTIFLTYNSWYTDGVLDALHLFLAVQKYGLQLPGSTSNFYPVYPIALWDPSDESFSSQYIGTQYPKYVTTYSKGTTKYTNVTSTSSTAYPDNGRSGSYWYVKIS